MCMYVVLCNNPKHFIYSYVVVGMNANLHKYIFILIAKNIALGMSLFVTEHKLHNELDLWNVERRKRNLFSCVVYIFLQMKGKSLNHKLRTLKMNLF